MDQAVLTRDEATGADLDRAWPARISPEDEATLNDALIDGTTVATDRGWRPVETLAPGTWVMAADGRYHPLAKIERHSLWAQNGFPRRVWPLRIPPDLFGNATPLNLLPRQRVQIDRPRLLAEAMRFDGLAGVAAGSPGRELCVTRLRFAKPLLVLANYGAVLACPGPRRPDSRPPVVRHAPLGLEVVPMRG